MTNVDNSDTKYTINNETITTRAIYTSEHSSAPLVVFLVLMIMCHTTLAQVHWVCHLHAMLHMCRSPWSSPTPFLLQPVLLPSSSSPLSWCTLTCTPTSTTWTADLIPSSSHDSRKSLEGDEVTHVPSPCVTSRMVGSVLEEDDGLRSCLIELQSFPLSKIDVDPIHGILMFLPCFVHVLCTTWCSQVDRVKDPYVLCPWDPQANRILSVCCSNFVLPISILNWWWNVNWLHIRHDRCTWRNRPE